MNLNREVEPLRSIANISFAHSDLRGAVERVHAAIEARSGEVFAFCNMHTFNLAQRNEVFASVLKECIVLNDGVGIDLASRFLCGEPFPANLNGTDLTPAILAMAERPLSLFLVGSVPGVAEEAARNLAVRFRQVSIVGVHHGYFDADGSSCIIKEIEATRPDLVVVGMGNPQQELWGLEAAKATGAVVLCVGAFIDFAAGRFSRAPVWVRNLQCEWCTGSPLSRDASPADTLWAA